MRMQYRTLQVPTKGRMAFLPVASSQATASSNGQNKIVGMPGTVPVPSPRPPALDDQGLGGKYNQPSSCAPNVIYPSIYYFVPNDSVKFPGALLNDHVLPVPAKHFGRTAVQSQYRTRVGGRTATAAIRPFTKWPTYGGR